MLGKIISSTILIACGLLLVWKTEPIKRFTGSFDFAEKYLGSGGTYTFLKLCGIVIMVLTFMWMTGTLENIIPDFLLNSGGIQIE
jgi:hypothetical protein